MVPSINEPLFKFNKIPSRYYPFVRWWWFGNNIEKKEITRELNLMHDAKIGGVEIQSIYPAKKGSTFNDEKDTKWLSQEWLELMKHAVEVGKELEIQTDMTFGNGWPFGGPHITPELASTKLEFVKKRWKSESMDLHTIHKNPDKIVTILAVNTRSIILSKNDLIDLSKSINLTNNQFQWKPPTKGKWFLLKR